MVLPASFIPVQDLTSKTPVTMGPVFEDIDLGPRKTSFKRLTALGAEAITAANAVTAEINKTPVNKQTAMQQNITGIMGMIVSFVQSFTPQPNSAGVTTTYLPDVDRYW